MAGDSKKTIIIGTTSINRSALHSDNIPEWYNYINALDKSKYTIQWFINIDYIDKLGESVQDTVENYQRIIADIPVTIVEKRAARWEFFACLQASVRQY